MTTLIIINLSMLDVRNLPGNLSIIAVSQEVVYCFKLWQQIFIFTIKNHPVMATKQKTKPTEVTVESFLGKLDSESVREDCNTLIKVMKKITKAEPKMWGPSIIGFGQYHYKYESGHEGFSCLTGFSPRKPAISVYLMGMAHHPELLEKLGKHKAAKGCLYIKKLEDIDLKILEKLIINTVNYLKEKFPGK